MLCCAVLLGNRLAIPLLYSSLSHTPPPPPSLLIYLSLARSLTIRILIAQFPIISTFIQPEAPIPSFQRWFVRPQSVQARLTRREPNSVRPLRLNPTSSSLPPSPRNGKPKPSNLTYSATTTLAF